MDDTPKIEIFGGRVVHFDHCQVGHISNESGVRRFWFWPEYDARVAQPITSDLTPWLNDSRRLRRALRGALLRAIAQTPNMSYRAPKYKVHRIDAPRAPFETYAKWLARKRALIASHVAGLMQPS